MNVQQYLRLQNLAANLRMNRVASAYVDFDAKAGQMRPRVSYAVAEPELGAALAEPSLSGADLAAALSSFAKNFLDSRLPGWDEGAGCKGQVDFDASGALLFDVTPRNACSVQPRIIEVVDLSQARCEALQSCRLSLLTKLVLKEDLRLEPLTKHPAAHDAILLLSKETAPGDSCFRGMAQRLWEALPGVARSSLPAEVIAKRIEERLFCDQTIRQAPWFAGSIYDLPEVPRDRPEGLGKAPLWLQLDALEAERLFKMIEASSDPILREIRVKMEIGLDNIGADGAFRDAVIEKYAVRLTDGDVDFQPDGLVSKGDEGAYVMAFLWVTNAEAGIADPGSDPEEGLGR